MTSTHNITAPAQASQPVGTWMHPDNAAGRVDHPARGGMISKRTRKIHAAAAGKAESLKRDVNQVTEDLAKVKEAVETLQTFYFMRTDAECVHGLQDWTEAMWAEAVAAHPEHAAPVVEGLLSVDEARSRDSHALASAIRQRLGSAALSAREWGLVLKFQNVVLNHGHHHDDSPAAIHYLAPPLLSNVLFNREFPLGIEGSVMRQRYAFAVRHPFISTPCCTQPMPALGVPRPRP